MNNKSRSMKNRLFILSQYVLPHHLLSRWIGGLADTRIHWLKNLLIRAFIRHFKVNMQEAQFEQAKDYENFNAFFTRPLKEQARPLQQELGAILSPCDAQISQIGQIAQGRLIQAKGHHFSLIDLVGGDTQKAAPFMGGAFATLYLSPRDYHRVHMPVEGTLREMIYIPGRLFSVNQETAHNVPNLFARNERVVCFFDTPIGPMAMVLVGAMIVASIETVWAGSVTPPQRRLKHFYYDEAALAPVHLQQGAEMGRFKLGSTVILLFGPQAMSWNDQLRPSTPIRMGELLGQQGGTHD